MHTSEFGDVFSAGAGEIASPLPRELWILISPPEVRYTTAEIMVPAEKASSVIWTEVLPSLAMMPLGPKVTVRLPESKMGRSRSLEESNLVLTEKPRVKGELASNWIAELSTVMKPTSVEKASPLLSSV